MFNPFVPFTTPLLHAFVKKEKTFFVRQQFMRGRDHFDEGIKGCFIFTHYREMGHAQHHYSAISHDPYRYVYDWSHAQDREKLAIAAGGPPGYKIFSGVFKTGWKKHITSTLRQKARKYIESELGWKPASSQTVGFDIYASHGELYARITLKAEEACVKLEDVENIR